jgi:hypothetical protein
MCYNQGELAQYYFLASELHKDLKTLIVTGETDTKVIGHHVEALEDFLNSKLENVFKENTNRFILKYFDGRRKRLPRACIKIHRNGIIYDIFRDSREYPVIHYSIESNTGFKHVYETGKNYSCNDIPKRVGHELYKNPRLDDKIVRASYKPKWPRWRYRNKTDYEWMSVWRNIQLEDRTPLEPSAESCYKSTIIIPLTLLGNTLTNKFKELFKIEEISQSNDRAIYGYLCFDHHEIRYFKDKEDVDMGYFFADILSLFLIARLTYTEYSKTFQHAKKILSC